MTVSLNEKVMTNVIELWKCKNVTVNVRESPFSGRLPLWFLPFAKKVAL